MTENLYNLISETQEIIDTLETCEHDKQLIKALQANIQGIQASLQVMWVLCSFNVTSGSRKCSKSIVEHKADCQQTRFSFVFEIR